jgi:acyl carrier protein
MASQTAARALALAAVHEALRGLASEGELSSLAPDEDLREALELDPVDFLSFVERLADVTGHCIDEEDYPRLATLASCADFLTGR